MHLWNMPKPAKPPPPPSAGVAGLESPWRLRKLLPRCTACVLPQLVPVLITCSQNTPKTDPFASHETPFIQSCPSVALPLLSIRPQLKTPPLSINSTHTHTHTHILCTALAALLFSPLLFSLCASLNHEHRNMHSEVHSLDYLHHL